MQLAQSHVVVVSGNGELRDAIVRVISAAGGIPHAATTRTQALGMLLELYQNRIIPRAIVVSWDMCPPASQDRQFYELLGMPEETTAYRLVKHARTLDRHIAIMVVAECLTDIKEGAPAKYEFQVLRWPTEEERLVARLLEDPRMADMKEMAYQRRRTEEFEPPRRSADDSDEVLVRPAAKA